MEAPGKRRNCYIFCFDEVIRNGLLQSADVSVCVQNLTDLLYEMLFSFRKKCQL